MHALIPHSDFGADYCGCLMEVVEANEARFICNECGLSSRRRMSPVSSWRWNLARPPALTGARVNQITSLSEVFAFRGQFCGQGSGL
jgi:hypothetical protein